MHITFSLHEMPQSMNHVVVLSSALKSVMAAGYDDLSEGSHILEYESLSSSWPVW